jgi:hypothetical protein
MLTEKQFLFLREALLQLQQAVQAIETFGHLQASNARPLWQFKALDDFLDHTARAEAIFWPREKYEARGKDLRRLVALEDSNPLHDHRLRNRLQHFDEYLENWLSKPDSEAHIGDLCIVSKVTYDGKRIYGLREFLSPQSVYVFQGEHFPISPIEAAARDLIARIKALPPHPLGPF